MDAVDLRDRVRLVAGRFRKPDPARLAWEEPLRSQLLRRLLVLSIAAESLFLLLSFTGVVRSRLSPWLGFEALLLLLLCGWLLRRGNVAGAAGLLVVSLSHVAAFVMSEYPASSAAPALLLPTIIICGLVIGGYFLAGWTLICAAILLLITTRSVVVETGAIVFWCAAYGAIAYLIWLFTSHLEALLAASRRAEEERHAAVVEERTRLAREIHDTLAQGFTGIVVQINAAEQVAADRSPDVWSHLERARTLARQSLDEARRSILALRVRDSERRDLLEAIRATARQLLVDDSVELEVTREGEPFDLPGNIESELLRVGQEAVTNAIRHARATTIQVSLQYLRRSIRLRVTDNGIGLPANARGLGIQGMEERMRRLHGNLEIVGHNGAGTTVIATVTVNRS